MTEVFLLSSFQSAPGMSHFSFKVKKMANFQGLVSLEGNFSSLSPSVFSSFIPRGQFEKE